MNRPDLLEKELTGEIIAAFFHVYNTLGFGFLEANYSRALVLILEQRGIHAAREVAAPVYFEGHEIGLYRLDMLVARRVIVEIKATDVLPPSAKRQLRNYLTATRLQVGLLLHFGPTPRCCRIGVGR